MGALPPPRWQILLAFAAIYLVWGSTYLATYFAVETLPPFLMGGLRFLIAGGVLVAWALLRGAPVPRLEHWRGALVIGALLLLIGNGVVVWAQQTVPSGLTALLVSTVPLWMVLLEWLRPGGALPGPRMAAGAGIGLVGLVLLIGPAELSGGALDPFAVGAILVATLCWSAGSLYARHAPLPESPALAIGAQMVAGGVLLLLAGAALGEPARFQAAAVSGASLLAFLYLLLCGSFIGFSAYLWLLRVQPPARVATHAYVNPVIAVVLGWGVAGERLGPQALLGAGVITLAVLLIVSGARQPKPFPAPAASEPEPAYAELELEPAPLAAPTPAFAFAEEAGGSAPT